MRNSDTAGVKVVGHRRPARGGLRAADTLLHTVIELRGDKPFMPRGLHRFKTFEEAQEWSIRMMARQKKPGRRP